MKKFTKAGAKFAAAAAVSVMALGYTTSVWAEENTVVKIEKEFADIKGTQTVSLPNIEAGFKNEDENEIKDSYEATGLYIHNSDKLNIINKDEGGVDIFSHAIANKNAVCIGISVKEAQANFDINGYFYVRAKGFIEGTEANVSMRAVGFSGEKGSSQIKAESVYFEAINRYYRKDSTENRETPTGTLVKESLVMALNKYAVNILAEENINISSYINNNANTVDETEPAETITAQGLSLSNESKASLQAGGRITIEATINGSTSNNNSAAINASYSKIDMKAKQGIKIAAANIDAEGNLHYNDGYAIVADNSEIALDGGDIGIYIRGNVNVLNNSVLKLSGQTKIMNMGGVILRSATFGGAPSGSDFNVKNSKLVVDGFTKISESTAFENAKIYLYDDSNTSEGFHALSIIGDLNISENNELFLRADSSKAAGDVNSDFIGIGGAITGDGKFNVNVFDKGMKNGYGMGTDGPKDLTANPITVLYSRDSTIDFTSLINSKKVNVNDMHYDNGIWNYAYIMDAEQDGKSLVIKNVKVKAQASDSQRSLHSANKAAGALAIGVFGNDNALHAHLREAQGAGEREEVWAQYLGGKLKSDGVQLKHNGVELGYDAYVGSNWTFGVSGMQTRGNTQLDSGSGKAKTNVGTVYGAWHGGSSYLNLEAKAGRVSSESKNFGGTVLQKIAGEFSAPAYSVSAEYGSTHELLAAWYLEPAVRLSYVHLGAADYGVQVQDTLARVANDSLDSFILRGGAKMGRRLGAKGSFYVKAAAVYEFGGDLATTVSADGRTEHYEDSLGGWGVEYGAGLEYKLGKAANISLDVERRSGGELKRDWGVNVGVNYSF